LKPGGLFILADLFGDTAPPFILVGYWK
jgi:hypothetical protein